MPFQARSSPAAAGSPGTLIGVNLGIDDGRLRVQVESEPDHLAGRRVVAEDLGVGLEVDRCFEVAAESD